MVVKKFQVQFIATNDKIIDVLISPLNFTYFAFFFRSKLVVCSYPQSTCRSISELNIDERPKRIPNNIKKMFFFSFQILVWDMLFVSYIFLPNSQFNTKTHDKGIIFLPNPPPPPPLMLSISLILYTHKWFYIIWYQTYFKLILSRKTSEFTKCI